jgi:hypothetical protein
LHVVTFFLAAAAGADEEEEEREEETDRGSEEEDEDEGLVAPADELDEAVIELDLPLSLCLLAGFFGCMLI